MNIAASERSGVCRALCLTFLRTHLCRQQVQAVEQEGPRFLHASRLVLGLQRLLIELRQSASEIGLTARLCTPYDAGLPREAQRAWHRCLDQGPVDENLLPGAQGNGLESMAVIMCHALFIEGHVHMRAPRIARAARALEKNVERVNRHADQPADDGTVDADELQVPADCPFHPVGDRGGIPAADCFRH